MHTIDDVEIYGFRPNLISLSKILKHCLESVIGVKTPSGLGSQCGKKKKKVTKFLWSQYSFHDSDIGTDEFLTLLWQPYCNILTHVSGILLCDYSSSYSKLYFPFIWISGGFEYILNFLYFSSKESDNLYPTSNMLFLVLWCTCPTSCLLLIHNGQ